MKVYAGTSGYSYKEWKSAFYPEDLKPDDWLNYYASQLPSVEINNTFYRMPRSHVVEAWRDAVPKRFRFVIKASRRITHQQRLKDCEEAVDYLTAKTDLLGKQLGAVLFQLPPYLRADLDRLEAFQSLLPDNLPVAFEFRHDSWLDADVDGVLNPRGHARVISHDESSSNLSLSDNPLQYLRLRAMSYTPAALRGWHKKLANSGAKTAFVFFKHEDAGLGPKLAAQFLEIVAKGHPAPQRAPRKATSRRRSAG